jgi:hypothetical protein
LTTIVFLRTASQWQFSIQRQLPSQIVAEAAYVGMLTLKQVEAFNVNEKPDQYLALGAAENNRVPNPFSRRSALELRAWAGRHNNPEPPMG